MLLCGAYGLLPLQGQVSAYVDTVIVVVSLSKPTLLSTVAVHVLSVNITTVVLMSYSICLNFHDGRISSGLNSNGNTSSLAGGADGRDSSSVSCICSATTHTSTAYLHLTSELII